MVPEDDARRTGARRVPRSLASQGAAVEFRNDHPRRELRATLAYHVEDQPATRPAVVPLLEVFPGEPARPSRGFRPFNVSQGDRARFREAANRAGRRLAVGFLPVTWQRAPHGRRPDFRRFRIVTPSARCMDDAGGCWVSWRSEAATRPCDAGVSVT
jgi:hypothetical protein